MRHVLHLRMGKSAIYCIKNFRKLESLHATWVYCTINQHSRSSIQGIWSNGTVLCDRHHLTKANYVNGFYPVISMGRLSALRPVLSVQSALPLPGIDQDPLRPLGQRVLLRHSPPLIYKHNCQLRYLTIMKQLYSSY